MKKKKPYTNIPAPKKMKCLNCGKNEAHFVPPSLGEVGFYTCEKQ